MMLRILIGPLSHFTLTCFISSQLSTLMYPGFAFPKHQLFSGQVAKKTWSLDWNTFSDQLSSENPQTGKI